jgi:cobalt-zinc-cadmium efflux system outer membrane protein
MHYVVCGALLRVAFLAVIGFSTTSAAQLLTLREAQRLGLEANPALKSAEAARGAFEGQLAESRAPLWNNPSVSFDPSRRTAPQVGDPTQRIGEWSAGLSQTFEIAGQRAIRLEASTQDLASLDAALTEQRAQLLAEIDDRFVKVLSPQRRLELERANLKLVEDAASAVGKRVAAGESTRLDGNLARIEAERTRNQIGALEEQLVAARSELAQLVQLAPERLPEVAGEIERTRAYSREELLERAASRPVLHALERREAAARSRVDLERAATTPDVTVGVSIGREGPYDLRERTIGLSVSLPLPLFRRNEAGIGKALAELEQARIELRAANRDSRAAVLALWKRHEALRARVGRLKTSVLPPLEENLRLSQAAFRAGEIGLTEILLVNRQVLEGRRDVLEAETEARLAQNALERAAGWTEDTGRIR